MDRNDSLIHKIFDTPVQSAREARPLYLQLQQRIRDAIRNGVLRYGDAIPPEREIAGTMGVSRVTVRRAIDDLVTEGLLIQRQGSAPSSATVSSSR
ncbi:GntR family transcriptional regulator [Marinobacterium aestuariivivens]|uniref:GntR family transcriptional regulator n=1 Tax=Marinobacterium aestuariivivens TaxID=1698799 RepID=A0ABW2A746_9GAMM